MFCEDGFRRPLWEFSFHIETCNHPPVFCKPPRSVPNESEVMRNLTESLDKNGVMEEDNGPWGALVVLSVKPYQGTVP